MDYWDLMDDNRVDDNLDALYDLENEIELKDDEIFSLEEGLKAVISAIDDYLNGDITKSELIDVVDSFRENN